MPTTTHVLTLAHDIAVIALFEELTFFQIRPYVLVRSMKLFPVESVMALMHLSALQESEWTVVHEGFRDRCNQVTPASCVA